jgi:DNA (cytosine-5)-methyltransferase 1
MRGNGPGNGRADGPRRPRLLDLFCGAGGCAVGYHRAGFEIVGVDLKPQPNYPFEFHRGDALEFLAVHGRGFDAIHASPPCQAYSIGRHIHNSGKRHPDLVAPTRDLLDWIGKPWVIENVVGSPLRDPVVLCGLMFDLKVLRHRLFESSVLLSAPPHPKHPKGNLTNANQGYSTGSNGFVCVAGNNFCRKAGTAAMDVPWMKSRREVAQAIPPAYTEFIGRQLLAHLGAG